MYNFIIKQLKIEATDLAMDLINLRVDHDESNNKEEKKEIEQKFTKKEKELEEIKIKLKKLTGE